MFGRFKIYLYTDAIEGRPFSYLCLQHKSSDQTYDVC